MYSRCRASQPTSLIGSGLASARSSAIARAITALI
jgi:hypothetical protein